jgi:extradiol dioxygenase family protein
VLDATEAEQFYSSAFGARTVGREEALVVMDLAGQRLALREVASESISLQRGARDGLRARHFGFGVAARSEVDAAVASLTALGAELVVKPTDRSDGRSAMFCDASGNQIEVYYEEMNNG